MLIWACLMIFLACILLTIWNYIKSLETILQCLLILLTMLLILNLKIVSSNMMVPLTKPISIIGIGSRNITEKTLCLLLEWKKRTSSFHYLLNMLLTVLLLLIKFKIKFLQQPVIFLDSYMNMVKSFSINRKNMKTGGLKKNAIRLSKKMVPSTIRTLNGKMIIQNLLNI